MLRRSRAVTFVAASSIMLAGAYTATSPAEAAYPGANGRIAHTALVDHRWDIYTVRSDGSGKVKLTSNGHSHNPVYSPSGKRILYNTGGLPARLRGIWVMDETGAHKRHLVTGSTDSPSWSPDGRRFVYTTPVSSPNGTMFVYSLVTRSSRRVMSGVADPIWSPDGHRIAFARGGDLFTIRVDGTGLRSLTKTADVVERKPNWAPGGGRLVFTRMEVPSPDYPQQTYGLAVINRDGTGRVDFANTHESAPVWSPNRRWIAAVRQPLTGDTATLAPGIWLFAPDGTKGHRVLSLARPSDVDWQPIP